jgi:hypothetical protein
MPFKGNDNLRHAREKLQLTPEQLLEFNRCREDPLYFVENYVKILSLDSKQLVNFKLREYQLDLFWKVIKDREVIAKWARQSGKTTTVAAAMAWLILFNTNYRVLIVAHMHEKAIEVLDVVKQIYEYLPPHLQHGVINWGKKSIRIGNKSMIKTAGTSGSSGRGGTYHFLYMDEFAHVPGHIAEDFWNSVLPTISSGKDTKVVVTSTPKGLNFFFKLWDDSEKGINKYNRSEINWWDVPGRDDAWRVDIIKSRGEDYFRQEFASEFLGSSNTLIKGEVLKRLVYRRPVYHSDNLDIYKEPEPGRIYAITVDLGEGIGQDYSVIMCFDITHMPYEVAAVYRSNWDPTMKMPLLIYNMGKKYGNCMVVIETASEGASVAKTLHYDMMYPYVLSTTTTTKHGQKISGGFAANSRYGIKMTVGTKRLGCTTLKALVEGDQLFINDEKLRSELFNFAAKGNSFEAENGHDDHVMCCVMFGWLVDQGYIRNINNVNMHMTMADKYRMEMEDQKSPLLIHDNGMFDERAEMIALLNKPTPKGFFQSPTPDPEPNPDKANLPEWLTSFVPTN